MYELIQISEHDYYIDCPAKIGLVRVNADEVILIDSGSDKDAGKKALRAVEGGGWKLKAVYNTHSHADHIGGNRYLQEKTGCPIYARGMERVYANTPLLEPIGLFGGLPLPELKHKFLLAQESRVEELTPEVLPEGMTLLELPGHCFDMTGFLTPDGTAYIADSVSSAETLEKYGIGYLWDAQTALTTLEALPGIKAKRFVPSHAAVTEDILPLAETNAQAIRTLLDRITECCREGKTAERLLKELMDAYGMVMTAQQYALIGSTVRGCLTGLYAQGRVRLECADNELMWKTAEA